MNTFKLLLIINILIFTSFSFAKNLHDNEDSIHNVLGIKKDMFNKEELTGKDIKELRLYTTDDHTAIMFFNGRKIFVYTIENGSHETRAAALYSHIIKYGISTFIAETSEYKRERYKSYFKVIAIQIKAQNMNSLLEIRPLLNFFITLSSTNIPKITTNILIATIYNNLLSINLNKIVTAFRGFWPFFIVSSEYLILTGTSIYFILFLFIC